MEAWIVHIRQEWINDIGDEVSNSNRYSAWATERQALKSICDWLKTETLKSWGNVFVDREELQNATIALLEADKIKEAISLVNRYTLIQKRATGRSSVPHKIIITIHESRFLGSPFE